MQDRGGSGQGVGVGGITGGCTPPYDFEQPLPLIYKAYCIVATCWFEANYVLHSLSAANHTVAVHRWLVVIPLNMASAMNNLL